MAQVFREISIEWGGEEYTFTPSNKLLRSIDAGLSPNTLLGVAAATNGADVPLYAIAYIISRFIQAGGGDCDEDDVLAGLYADMMQNKGAGIEGLVGAIAEVLMPPGNAIAPAPGPSKKAKKQPARK